MTLLQLLAQSSYITYNKAIANKYGLEVAILLGAMCSYQTAFGVEFYKTRKEIEIDTALSDYAIRKATDNLVKIGFLTVTLKGSPARNYYTINIEALSSQFVEINELDMRNQQTSSLKSTNPIISNNNKITNNEQENNTKINTIKSIVDYLNSVCGTAFRATASYTQSHINQRLREGFTVDDFKLVIDYKFREWGNDARMKAYLRPETLFGTKFESYLQAAKATMPHITHFDGFGTQV